MNCQSECLGVDGVVEDQHWYADAARGVKAIVLFGTEGEEDVTFEISNDLKGIV